MVEGVRESAAISSLRHDITRYAFVDALHEHVRELELGAPRDGWGIRGSKRRQGNERDARILERKRCRLVASFSRGDIHHGGIDHVFLESASELTEGAREGKPAW